MTNQGGQETESHRHPRPYLSPKATPAQRAASFCGSRRPGAALRTGPTWETNSHLLPGVGVPTRAYPQPPKVAPPAQCTFILLPRIPTS